MSATIHTLQRTQSFPERIEGCLQAADWSMLQKEIESSFDPTITAYGGLSLFECILHRADQDSYVPPLPLPKCLLESLIQNGVGEKFVCGKPTVVACAEYGQWEWVNLLLDAGFVAQSEDFPILDAIAMGRSQRCEDAVLDQIRNRLASVDGETDAERAEARARCFSNAMMVHARVIYAKDTRSISHLVHRLVNECGVDPDAPIKDEPKGELRDIPGVRNVPNALDHAILRQDEAMALALMDAGASCTGAVRVESPNLGPVVCRPLDLAMSAHCYELFSSILVEDPESKEPFPGASHPMDPAAFPVTSVMVSNLIPVKNGASILDELLRKTSQHWTSRDLGNAMHVAAKAGQVEMMQILASHGVAYDIPTSNGFLPIHQACSGANKEAIDFLLSQGSNLSDESNTGVKAFDLLQASSPDLAAKYAAPAESNIVMFRPRPRR